MSARSAAALRTQRSRSSPYGALLLAALRGREAELLRLVEPTVSDAAARGDEFALAIAELSHAILYNGLGRYDAALAAVGPPGEHPGGSRNRALAERHGRIERPEELIEAAVRCGDRDLAERSLERLAGATRASGTNWAPGIEARSRALLSDGDTADHLYREAIERLGRTPLGVDLARAHLVYGEWLRRERRRLDAREQLRIALERFSSMGAEAFAGRAERELLATGERVRRRSVETRDELTVQEAQVARMAGGGLSNDEIGERLYISPHTVAYHLRKVYAMLDITSRNQLGRALPESAKAGPIAER